MTQFKLTDQQIAQYHRDGYLIVAGLQESANFLEKEKDEALK
jgi:hypothetical protein